MKYHPLPSSFFADNRKTLMDIIEPNSVVLLFSPDEYPKNGDQLYKFRQNSDLYHLSGIHQEETILMLRAKGEKQEANTQLFIKSVDEKTRIWHGEKLTLEEAKSLSGIEHIDWEPKFESKLAEEIQFANLIYFLATPDITSFDGVGSSNSRRIRKLHEQFPEKTFIPINPFLLPLRLIKKEAEMDAIKKAVAITRDAYFRVLETTKPQQMEHEVEAAISYEFISQGANGHAYEPIVASGKNTCILHYVDNDSMLLDGDLLLLDFGAEYAYYAADCSRTIPVNGKYSPRQKECYNAVLEVFEKAKKLYTPGNTINIINDKVGQWMQEKMIVLGLFTQEQVDHYQGDEPLYKKYFMHGTAHFIGLDVHDVGDKDTIFETGMVLSCEPAIYIPEENIGIRIETDMVVNTTPIDLMDDFPLTIEEIEAAMSK
jgi:Xaa-Pro aminopeptidase